MAHQEAIMNTIQWVTDLQNRITNLLSANDPLEKQSQINAKTGPVKRRKSSASSNVSTVEKKSRRLKTKSALAAIVEDQLSDISKSLLLVMTSFIFKSCRTKTAFLSN